MYIVFTPYLYQIMKNSGLYKGCLEPIILKLLKENGRMYGYEITTKVKENTFGELNITEGALYPLLHRLESEGILESESEMAGNRPRKYYKLTTNGKLAEAESTNALVGFINTLQALVHPKPGF